MNSKPPKEWVYAGISIMQMAYAIQDYMLVIDVGKEVIPKAKEFLGPTSKNFSALSYKFIFSVVMTQ